MAAVRKSVHERLWADRTALCRQRNRGQPPHLRRRTLEDPFSVLVCRVAGGVYHPTIAAAGAWRAHVCCERDSLRSLLRVQPLGNAAFPAAVDRAAVDRGVGWSRHARRAAWRRLAHDGGTGHRRDRAGGADRTVSPPRGCSTVDGVG